MKICKICNKEFKRIGPHVRQSHGLSNKEYYDLYERKGNEGFCEYCNNFTKFENINEGYKRFCCVKCRAKGTQEELRRTKLERYGDSNYNNMEKTRKTKEERYDDPNYNNKDQRKQTNLDIYGVEYPMQTEEVKEKQKETLVENHGVEHPAQSNEIMEKIEQTKLERYGDPYFTNREKSKQTNLERYGDPYYNNPEKARQTNLERYGVEFPSHLNEIIEKIQQTNLERYGTKCSINSDEVREKVRKSKLERYGDEKFVNPEKARQTNLKRYGVECPLELNEIQEKIKQTNLEKYGVPYPIQNSEIAEKISSYSHSWHTYITPSGKEIRLQGYEPQALDLLLEDYSENKICYRKSDVPEIWYRWDNTNTWHRYYPDFYLPSENLVVEVKSEYTMNSALELNLVKKEAVELLGYNFEFMIIK